MTATVEDSDGRDPKMVKAGGILNMEAAIELFEDDCGVYMQAFANKAKVDTNGLLRYDAVCGFFGLMVSSIQQEFRDALEEHETWDEENVAVNDNVAKLLEELKKLKAEKERLVEFETQLKK